ncbi:MAG: YihY/virulence factor BrkB family protein [Acidimicrobiales bacterium]
MANATGGDSENEVDSHTTFRDVRQKGDAVASDVRARAREFEEEVRGPGAREVLRSALRHMSVDRVTVAAGAFAYRWFLSIFPTIIALLGVASLVAMPQSFAVSLIHGVERALPSGAAQVFTKAIRQATLRTSRNLAATVVASLVALWSAVSGMVIVEQGLGMAYGVARDRTFFGKRRMGFALLVGGIVLGGGASALVVFGSSIGESIRHAPVSGLAFEAVWSVIRWVVALVLINLLFTMLYYFAPNRKAPRWRWTSVGAVVATVLWAIVSFGFSFYTSDFSSYNNTYGAFAGVAILVFWLYLTGLAILVGGEINAARERLGLDEDVNSD